MKPAPLVFAMREDTVLRAFVYTALVAAITTGLVLEYRLVNPFGTYVDSVKDVDRSAALPYLTAAVQTSSVAFGIWLISLVVFYIFFQLGTSLVL
jgi:hypothetical protein